MPGALRLQDFWVSGGGSLRFDFRDSLGQRVMIRWLHRRETMRPKKPETTGEGDLFRARLEQIIDLKHELVQLAGKIDWDWIDREIAPLYSDKGRPGIPTRFAIGLLLLKQIYGLSDEVVCERWVYDPYFQFFTGEEFFQHEFPHERSDLSHWRKRLGDKLEVLLAESLRVAHASGALRTRDLARITVDTTVQPKNIAFPTDAKLLHAAIKGLNRLARRHGVRLRQSYLRVAKRAAMMAGRYAHAKQFKRHRRELRILRSRLGRIIRDIRRKIAGRADIEAVFEWPLARASQIRSQQQCQRGVIKRELRRRSAIEAVIGHMKTDGHLGRCYLKGRAGDAANAVLTAVGYNLRLVLAWLRILLRLILGALLQALALRPPLKEAS